MRRLLIPALAFAFAVSLAGANAKSMMMTSAQAKAQIMDLQGSWTCKGDMGTPVGAIQPWLGLEQFQEVTSQLLQGSCVQFICCGNVFTPQVRC